MGKRKKERNVEGEREKRNRVREERRGGRLALVARAARRHRSLAPTRRREPRGEEGKKAHRRCWVSPLPPPSRPHRTLEEDHAVKPLHRRTCPTVSPPSDLSSRRRGRKEEGP
ncbi:uncharacterized protein DS421_12g375610 [Arachis hypogaea]|nr:uncharacterized protein DS421_12g375610 [Arachis hypogaea]